MLQIFNLFVLLNITHKTKEHRLARLEIHSVYGTINCGCLWKHWLKIAVFFSQFQSSLQLYGSQPICDIFLYVKFLLKVFNGISGDLTYLCLIPIIFVMIQAIAKWREIDLKTIIQSSVFMVFTLSSFGMLNLLTVADDSHDCCTYFQSCQVMFCGLIRTLQNC